MENKVENPSVMNKISHALKAFLLNFVVEPFKSARFLVILMGLIHLFIVTIHYDPIRKIISKKIEILKIINLDTRFSGVLLFFIILLSLVNIFNIIRIKKPTIKKISITLALLFSMLFILLMLLSIYLYVTNNQADVLASSTVQRQFSKAITLTIVVMGVYLASFIQIVRELVKMVKQGKKEKQI